MPKTKTDKQFKDEVYELYNNEYVVLTSYISSSTKVLVEHTKCGKKWWITPNNFLRGRKCPHCSHLKKYDEEFIRCSAGKFEMLDKYVDFNTKIRYKCLKHNYIFKLTPQAFKNSKYKCPKCKYEHVAKVQRKTNTSFKNQLFKKHQGIIVAKEAYINTHTKILFHCNKCNQDFKAEPNAILRISGCPYCCESKGEATIANTLSKLSVSYIQQKRFSGCKDKRELPFDFWLPDYNILIEYDGKQHSHSIKFFGGDAYLSNIRYKDSIKTAYAKNAGINLVRIPYTIEGTRLEKYIIKLMTEVKQRVLNQN